MVANNFAPLILSYEQISHHAAEFLKQHSRENAIPVDIERIAEFDLGLNMFPFPDLSPKNCTTSKWRLCIMKRTIQGGPTNQRETLHRRADRSHTEGNRNRTPYSFHNLKSFSNRPTTDNAKEETTIVCRQFDPRHLFQDNRRSEGLVHF